MKIKKQDMRQEKSKKNYKVTVKMTTIIPDDAFFRDGRVATEEQGAKELAALINCEGIWNTLSGWNFFMDDTIDWEVEVVKDE